MNIIRIHQQIPRVSEKGKGLPGWLLLFIYVLYQGREPFFYHSVSLVHSGFTTVFCLSILFSYSNKRSLDIHYRHLSMYMHYESDLNTYRR